MEVRQQGPDERERSVAVDEQLGAAGERTRGGRGLERPHRRGADGHDARGALARGHGRLRHGVPLAVHVVVLDLIRCDRAEGAQPDVELHGPDLGAGGAHRVQELRREVQAGGGGRHGRGPVGIGRLIALGVGQRRRDVGRQGDRAVALEHRQDVDTVRHLHVHESPSITEVLADHHGEVSRDGQPRPGAQLAAGPGERLPVDVRFVAGLQEEDLRRAAGGSPSREAGREHPGGVDHDDVPRPHQPDEVGDVAVPGGTTRTLVDQQARRVPRLHGDLGDGLRREVVVDGGGVHGGTSVPSAAGRGESAESEDHPKRPGGAAWPCTWRGAATPRWAKAAAVATRPRGVRISRPPWMRNGS